MLRILLVDDDDALSVMLQTMLVRGGYAVTRVANGKEALRHYDAKTIALVLTDLVMPDMEGMELITKLRHAHPDIKIIAMSGGINSKAYLPSARLLGADCTLGKPFTNDELFTAINSLLKPK